MEGGEQSKFGMARVMSVPLEIGFSAKAKNQRLIGAYYLIGFPNKLISRDSAQPFQD